MLLKTTSFHVFTAYVTSNHDQYSSARAEHRSARCGWFPNMFRFSSFENIELGYIHCALKENFNVTFEGFYMCFPDLWRTTCALGRN